ncbi:MAG: hypothetical protein PHC64_10390 [Candidatus Gastranaerophilales bacterium]|nr:hypothetical protein [Candidatus Gastranaerophilales bacterium]
MKLKTPKAISHGHANLCRELRGIINKYKNNEEQIKLLEKLMAEHFHKEEKYAMPPLGLLLTLSEGNWEINKETAIEMSQTVNSKLVELKEDHKKISKIVAQLDLIAKKENNSDLEIFLNNLIIHMDLEDEVLYPTAILIGDYFKKL